MEERIAVLYCNSTERNGNKTISHDKVYIAYLHELESGWVVDFAYGRRGKGFQQGTKTGRPLAYLDALRSYRNLVSEKTDAGRGANQYRDVSDKAERFASDDLIRRAFDRVCRPKEAKITPASEILNPKPTVKPVPKQAKPAPLPARQVEIEVRMERGQDDLPIELRFVIEERSERMWG